MAGECLCFIFDNAEGNVPRRSCEATGVDGVRRAGLVFLDDQPENKNNYRELITRLAAVYSTSRTSTQIRLRDLKIVVDQRIIVGEQRISGPVAIGSVLKSMIARLDDGTDQRRRRGAFPLNRFSSRVVLFFHLELRVVRSRAIRRVNPLRDDAFVIAVDDCSK